MPRIVISSRPSLNSAISLFENPPFKNLASQSSKLNEKQVVLSQIQLCHDIEKLSQSVK